MENFGFTIHKNQTNHNGQLITSIDNILHRVPRSEVGEVDMGWWGCSFLPSGYNGAVNRYLFTFGAAPCLNVVIHNPLQRKGCMTHIPHGDSVDDLDQQRLYTKACKVIVRLMAMCRSAADEPLLIWLGGGLAFSPGSAYAPKDPVSITFKEFVTKLVEDLHVREIVDNIVIAKTAIVKDDEPDSSEVLYDPANATLCLFSRNQLRAFYTEAPTHDQVQKAKIKGECEQFYR